MANIMITEAKLTPNPVEVSKQYILSVTIIDKVFPILTDDGFYLYTNDGYVIERPDETDRRHLMTDDGFALTNELGDLLEIMD